MKIQQLRSIMGALAFLLITVAANAQDQRQHRRGPGNHQPPHEQMQGKRGQQRPHGPEIPGLTEEQKKQMKAIHLATEKEALPLKNQVGEKEARLKTLTTAATYDERNVNKVVEEIGVLKTELEKLKLAGIQEVRGILTEEQLVFFNNRPHKGPKRGEGKRR